MGGDALRRVIGMSLGGMALFAALPARAQAQPEAPPAPASQEWVWCENRDGAVAPDASIKGCTALIEAGAAPAKSIPVIYNNRGIAYRFQGDLDHALADYNEAIRLDPRYDVAYHNRGRAYYIKREFDLAIADYGEALRINPRSRLAYVDRGLAWFAKHDANRAIADYTEAVKIDPKDGYAFNMRGMAYRVIGDTAHAVADHSEAIRLAPDFEVGYYYRALAYGDARQLDQAIADYDQALRINPKYENALVNRGLAWGEKKQFDRAIADYTQAIKLNEGDLIAFYDRGNAYRAKGDIDHAIADYSEAIKIDPNDAIAYAARGSAYSAKRDFVRARAQFRPGHPARRHEFLGLERPLLGADDAGPARAGARRLQRIASAQERALYARQPWPRLPEAGSDTMLAMADYNAVLTTLPNFPARCSAAALPSERRAMWLGAMPTSRPPRRSSLISLKNIPDTG